MKLTIKKKIGKNIYPFTFDGDNLHDVVMQSKKLSFPDVHKCGLCGGENLVLSAHVAQQKYKYTEIRCLNPDCRATLTFGQTQEDADTFYLRKDEGGAYAWQKFEPKEKQERDYGKSLNQQNEDLPF